MTYKLIVRAEARADISEANKWYEERREGLGLQFVRAIDTCLNSVRRNPNAYPRIYKQIHRALLAGFPFAVFFCSKSNRRYHWAYSRATQSRTLEETRLAA